VLAERTFSRPNQEPVVAAYRAVNARELRGYGKRFCRSPSNLALAGGPFAQLPACESAGRAQSFGTLKAFPKRAFQQLLQYTRTEYRDPITAKSMLNR
jgi:hypothetical protein